MLKHTASLSDESFRETLCENLLLPSFLLAYAWLHLLSYFNKSVDIYYWSVILPHLWNSVFSRGLSLRLGAKHLSATWETGIRSLGWEDPLEKEMATHSSILAWKIPRTEEPGRLRYIGS